MGLKCKFRIIERHRYIFTEKESVEQTTRLCERYYNSHFFFVYLVYCVIALLFSMWGKFIKSFLDKVSINDEGLLK